MATTTMMTTTRLLGIRLELVGGDLLELRRDAGDLVLVGATLEGGEHGVVNLLLELARVLQTDRAGQDRQTGKGTKA